MASDPDAAPDVLGGVTPAVEVFFVPGAAAMATVTMPVSTHEVTNPSFFIITCKSSPLKVELARFVRNYKTKRQREAGKPRTYNNIDIIYGPGNANLLQDRVRFTATSGQSECIIRP